MKPVLVALVAATLGGQAALAAGCGSNASTGQSGGDVGHSGDDGNSEGGAPGGSAGGGPGGDGAGGSSDGGSSGNAGGGASGTSGADGGSHGSGSTGGSTGSSSGGGGGGVGSMMGCGETLPATSDYGNSGPFSTTTIDNTGPDGGYTVVQPTTLGQNGFKHPIATWGNGITTDPSYYPTLLNLIASNGIVVVASNSTSVTSDDMIGGLDWMVGQNTTAGQYQGVLDTSCLVAIGYSLGGGAAVDTGSQPDIVTTVSFHGVTGTSGSLKTPLLLFTSTTDTFVVPSEFVTPTYEMSDVQTFYATLQDAGDPSDLGHLLPVSILDPTDPEYAPAMAWLRLWVYGDTGGMDYFWGSGALLCQAPDWQCQSKIPPAASVMTGF